LTRRARQNVFDRPRDHQIKRDAVLGVAAEMFNKRGYAATSLDEIAGRFNISKTSEVGLHQTGRLVQSGKLQN
jgi:AcrR family transcriptional regulator